MRSTTLLGLLTFPASAALLVVAVIGLAHSGLDAREGLLVTMGAAGLVLLPIGTPRLFGRPAEKIHL